MPDVKSCDPPPLTLLMMEPPLSGLSQEALFSCHRAAAAPHFPSVALGAPYPLMARCNSSTLLTNMGLRYGPGRQGPLQGLVPPSCVHTGSSRPYRSMENLNWSPITDHNLSSHCYRSADSSSEFILHYTATSHWFDGPPESMAFYPRQSIPRKDASLLPHWLLPGSIDEWDARKGLRDKLRLQSARAAGEAVKPIPLRPQVAMINGKTTSLKITSQEEIKQEVLRRLRLRRQNSTPDLALASFPCSVEGVKMSFTTDNIAGARNSSASENRRPPLGRLHIPTFEEFKKMRQKDVSTNETNKKASVSPLQENGDLNGQSKAEKQANLDSNIDFCTANGMANAANEKASIDTLQENRDLNGQSKTENQANFKSSVDKDFGTTQYSPIRTVPSPRGPPQTLASSSQDSFPFLETGGSCKYRRSSLDTVGTVPFPPNRESMERASSCCPALLLEGTDLSRYGEKIYKMKDGLIGSALDLIKKSCSAEISCESTAPLSPNHQKNTTASTSTCTATPHRVLTDESERGGGGGREGAREWDGEGCGDRGNASPQPPPVTMETTSGTETPAAGLQGERERTEEVSEEAREEACGVWVSGGGGCRRSSSDTELWDRGLSDPGPRVECRLRPHYSDPMPSDPSRRKQLEMKIAAASRLHRAQRDSAPAALRGRSEPPGEDRQASVASSRSAHHRWSTISSLSSDSGVVGLSDDRDEEESAPCRTRRGKGAEVERTDSGIGPGLSRSWKRPVVSLKPCPDCGTKDTAARERGERSCERMCERMCERCSKLRTERKEAILEFLNTESSYGEDLRIIKEEFYCPMASAGLLTAEQLAIVFANVQELIDVNDKFTEQLQDSIDQAFDQGDEDLLTVYIGEIFLEFVNMLPAFQTYCLQQSTSVNTLNTLEKEKELLRIFLDVSQNDNTALRRMNLRSFLMAPLQRVTKYPLLLSRIMKVTSECHADFPRLCEAKSRVESHLEHINTKTKQEGNGVSWSLRSFRRDSRKNREVINIEMREVSMRTVGWSREHTRFVMEGPLQLSQPADGQWVRKGSRTLKFQNVQTLLMVRTNRDSVGNGEATAPHCKNECSPHMEIGVQDGVLVLIKDKSSGKFAVLREPIRLANCVVSADPDCEDTFEVLDIKREAFVFRASDKSRTQQWFHQIKRYARDLGSWRKRRNALPNIMINTGQTRY